MAVDPVPWFVQAPAEHSAEVARTLAYQAIGGKEGLARAGDLTVRALPVPAGAVQVLPGAAGILNRGSGGAGQAYVGRVGAAVSVPIAATGSGAGRSDLIVFRVDDPQYGGAVPASPTEGPYIRLDVVSGVNATVTRVQDVPGHETDSAVTLARVDLPASTGTVTDAMVTLLARVANPQTLQMTLLSGPPPANQDLTASNWARWITPAEWQVDIPEWAGSVIIRQDVMNPIIMEAGHHGQVACFVKGVLAVSGPYAQELSGGSARTSTVAAGEYKLPAALRGTRQTFDLRARRISATGRLRADAQTQVFLSLTFLEATS